MSKEQARIKALTELGHELHERAEKWRQALVEIRRFNKDPLIEEIIKQHLNT